MLSGPSHSCRQIHLITFLDGFDIECIVCPWLSRHLAEIWFELVMSVFLIKKIIQSFSFLGPLKFLLSTILLNFCHKFHICGLFEILLFLKSPFWRLPNQQLFLTVLEECFLNPKFYMGQISVIHKKCPTLTVEKHNECGPSLT